MDGKNIFMEEEYYSWKTEIFKDTKEMIAKQAINYINSGNTILLDSGSTTLEIARQIGIELKKGSLNKLTIITNSIPAGYELLTW